MSKEERSNLEDSKLETTSRESEPSFFDSTMKVFSKSLNRSKHTVQQVVSVTAEKLQPFYQFFNSKISSFTKFAEPKLNHANTVMFKTSRLVTFLSIIGIFSSAFLLALIFTLCLEGLILLNFPLARVNFLAYTWLLIYYASYLFLISVGLTITKRIRKFGNFSHAEYIIVGIYTVITINSISGASTVFANIIFVQLIFAFFITGFIGVIGELLIFGPLIRRNAGPLSLLVASIGYGLIIRQLIQEFFGGTSRKIDLVYPAFFEPVGDIFKFVPVLGWFFNEFTDFAIPFLGSNGAFRISRDGIWSITAMIVMILLYSWIFNRTQLGISMRATADDKDLAEISGVNTRLVIYASWFLAAGITGVGAVFLLEDSEISPEVGFAHLLIIFAIATLGGFDSFEGTIISAFIISGIGQFIIIINLQFETLIRRDTTNIIDFFVFWTPSSDWNQAFPFLVLILILLFRPRGIFGLIDPRSKL